MNSLLNSCINVVQIIVQGELHSSFVEAIRPHAPALQNDVYAKRVLSKTYLKNKQYRLGNF